MVAKEKSSNHRFSDKLDLTIDDVRRLIESKAYELFVKRGCKSGNDYADWFEAEKIIVQQLVDGTICSKNMN